MLVLLVVVVLDDGVVNCYCNYECILVCRSSLLTRGLALRAARRRRQRPPGRYGRPRFAQSSRAASPGQVSPVSARRRTAAEHGWKEADSSINIIRFISTGGLDDVQDVVY